MLSISIIAKNASRTLPACIQSTRGLCDDVVVVVDSSTWDDTVKTASGLGARVYVRKFDNFSSQKNFAVSKCRYRWILALDADETVTPRLAEEIMQVLPGTRYSAFSIPRINYIFGRPICHTNWSPETDRHIWLFDKTKAGWSSAVHEQVLVTGPVGRLKNPKTHLNYQSVEQFIAKMNQYTSLEINSGKRSLTARLIRSHWLRVFFQPKWKFIRHYFLYLGFLDGWHGLFLSYLMAIYGLTLTVKSWQKQTGIYRS
ncbi:MAG: Glycosyl transferase family 2 [Candidatus Amesbacteria bacterium GW2011_GWB1_47_19]|nr:MAG: Glycosyl transferase family 2 [Candidatus Amesbacteria bacterium GW2011_GWA1_44_24]KKU31742.1 MAG: glycosyl transferase [Candidatus Amesbacteria bacterium GW2011_GWC1_46_24]KKU67655.1 MAG: Glycosyl transferase family 2 [Candidatus Amesbacteria bacterium GW2011_GWB1_47_19]OGD06505.1 MAG: hypothetical protein A2379_02585 [Candidatus Amesbacteria bacterium RIFOXYB1_FULL_47_13]HBC72908.1 hypothetical protein [Candidatus Amesbacteria bacterium]